MDQAILFDMDGVLVDVEKSYRLAIQQTVKELLGIEISPADIQKYKNRGGLNNDWDLTEAILIDNGESIDKKNIVATFQKYYLGRNYSGLIQNDRWQAPLELLTFLSRKYKIGIVTGRPREEARFTLKRFEVEGYFLELVTMDDVPQGRGKPDPFGLKLAMNSLRTHGGWYIGDTVDDMKAAEGAGMIPIGFINKSEEFNFLAFPLYQNGAQQVVRNFNELRRLFDETKG